MYSSDSPRRGSALLIVLGLISFLLISAVAFSISMRTESSAASAYRRSLLARELLATAFTDARVTLDGALTRQRQLANFNRDNPSTYTVEALAPFKHEGADRYGRLISSAASGSDVSNAGLVDDKVMRHVPPYVATAVYEILESGEGNYDANETLTNYNINAMANWKPIYAMIPENTDARTGSSNAVVNQTVVGRMAWAAINLSDSLDINAIGSNSAYRGLGFTGSEFAFGTMETNPPANALDTWFVKNENPASSVISLPTFCSNADFAQYVARASAPDLDWDNGSIAPFSWENAIATYDDGFYSPFSVYSFWPHMERKDESGTRIRMSTNNNGATTTIDPSRRIAANRVTENTIATTDAALSREVNSLVQTALATSGAETVGENFTRMLLDYIDLDSVPSDFGRNEMTAFSQPTVENTPMVSEVAFDNTGWTKTGYAKEMNDAILEAFNKLPIFKSGKTYKTLQEIPEVLDVDEVELKLAIPRQTVAYRAYFPGVSESAESYTIEIDPKQTIVSVLGAGDNGSPFDFEGEMTAEPIKSASFSIDVKPAADSPFVGSSVMTMEGSTAPKATVKGEHIPVVKPTEEQINKGLTEADAKIVRLTFLVDFLFRVQVADSGGEKVDLAPADKGSYGMLKASDYPKTLGERLNTQPMVYFDAQYFRVTRAVAVEFALYWKITEQKPTKEGEPPTYKAELQWVDNLEPRTPDEDLTAEVPIAGTAFKAMEQAQNSLLALSPESGAWFSVDPRYNWLSPMIGLSDGNYNAYFNDVGDGTPMPKLSSPHWLFLGGKKITSGSNASKVQDAYMDSHSDIVPFKWGLKIEDIRYGYNDAGQLLLPAEVGFLPVPLNTNAWTPSQTSYASMSLANYHNTVARGSFFRTLPITDLKDGVFTTTETDRYANLSNIFKGLDGANFPEEHRGIVNVFAGQDDYLLAQRLRQFAMLGIPPTIKQAAFVTLERLKQAAVAKRVSPEMVTQDLKALDRLQLPNGLQPPKYDDFIRDYLFPLPDVRTMSARDNARDWNKEHPLYGSVKARPTRPKTLDFIVDDADGVSFADRITEYNTSGAKSSGKLGQNDMTTLLALSKECFGDRQQLFLIVLRADAIRYNTNQALSQHVPLSTARAVALIWRDAYGELPDRVIYYQYIP